MKRTTRRIFLHLVEGGKKVNRSKGRTPEMPIAPLNDCISHLEISTFIEKFTADYLAIDELSVIDDDGFVSYGPVSLYFHNFSTL